jgi:fatty-acyl-CoA synthase
MYIGQVAREVPDKVAYVVLDEDGGTRASVTYRELDERSNRVAQLFAARGLRPGDGIAICMENNAAYFEVVWAAQRSGLYYTAANWRLTPDELAYMVDDSGAKVLVVSEATAASGLALRDRTPDVHTRLSVGVDLPGHERYESAIAAMPAEPLETELEGTDMLYSSGTTGRPKGIRVPLSGVAAGSEAGPLLMLIQLLYGFGRDSVYLSPAPLYHAAPLRYCVATMRLGATVIVMSKFDPEVFLATIERHHVTQTQVVPTMLVRMLKMPAAARTAHDLSSLRGVVHAAAPCPVQVKRDVIDWLGPIVHEYYAGSEGNGYVSCSSQEWLEHPGTVGRPLVGVPHIVDELGNELPVGETGTIWFSDGPEFSYHNDPAKTAETHDARGWSTLGDVGHLDEDGYLYLTDRKAYMIISGGVNIYPQEVEDLLVTHPSVLDAAVFGLPDDDMGERVHAVVQPVDPDADRAALVAELISHCRAHLAGYKRPKQIDVVDELPRHPTGKLYKRLLVEQYRAGAPTT